MKKIRLLLIGIIIPTLLFADEGMWMLPLIEELNIGSMTEMGLKLSPEDIYSINHSSLKDAVVRFGRGCTGEIISDQGLLLTNHHCGYGSIQSHSTIDHNYLEDGYWAKSLQEELPNPDLTVTFLVEIRDVTGQVLDNISDDINEKDRKSLISDTCKIIESEAVRGTHYEAQVRPFYGGNQFFLFIYEVFRDVRFVGAPPSSIGDFGGDTDNWMWPRHTGDFSLFRVYMSPDSLPATYSPDNIPLHPKYYLPLSLEGYEKGSFAMIIGYPGTTQRNITSWEIDELQRIIHPGRIKIRGLRQQILMEDMKADEEVRIKYASKYSSSSNYWKFSIGQSRGLTKLGIRDTKAQLEEDFEQWLEQNPVMQGKYGDALPLIRTAVENRAPLQHAYQYVNECFLRGCELIKQAYDQHDLYEALKSGDKERLKNELDNTGRKTDAFYKDYNLSTDKKSTRVMVRTFASDIREDFWPSRMKTLNRKYKGNWDKVIDNLFEKSIFSDPSGMEAFLAHPDLETLEKDPAFMFAESIRDKFREISDSLQEINYGFDRGHRLFIAGLREMKQNRIFYPDANSTMRLTYGKVLDYKPSDGVRYNYYTTLGGVMEKADTANYEFIVPEKLTNLYEKKDYGRYGQEGVLKVCFLTDNDITGGNSGSPVLNGKGELIGLAFDGNWEAMSGDIVFDPAVQRTICVDVRYVLFIIDKFAGAQNLVNELRINSL